MRSVDTAGAAKYAELFDEIKAAFNTRVRKAGRPDHRQHAVLLRNGAQVRPAAGAICVRRPRSIWKRTSRRRETISPRVSSASAICCRCSRDAGKTDTAYTLLMQDTFPSWLFSVKQGATTIWERWDGWTPEKGFQDPGMNSFNHYSLGSCGEWLFDTAAGIDLDPAQARLQAHRNTSARGWPLYLGEGTPRLHLRPHRKRLDA